MVVVIRVLSSRAGDVTYISIVQNSVKKYIGTIGGMIWVVDGSEKVKQLLKVLIGSAFIGT
jgi:hypothetical protein